MNLKMSGKMNNPIIRDGRLLKRSSTNCSFDIFDFFFSPKLLHFGFFQTLFLFFELFLSLSLFSELYNGL